MGALPKAVITGARVRAVVTPAASRAVREAAGTSRQALDVVLLVHGIVGYRHGRRICNRPGALVRVAVVVIPFFVEPSFDKHAVTVPGLAVSLRVLVLL